MLIINNTFHSLFFIFIQDHGKLSDNELLERLLLSKYEIVEDESERLKHPGFFDKRYLYISEDSNWKHLMDDLY